MAASSRQDAAHSGSAPASSTSSVAGTATVASSTCNSATGIPAGSAGMRQSCASIRSSNRRAHTPAQGAVLAARHTVAEGNSVYVLVVLGCDLIIKTYILQLYDLKH